MFQKRVIICLDVREGKTTKGIRFQGNQDIGDPVAMAEDYYRQGVDELVFYDITASVEKRNIILDVVHQVAEKIFVPFCVGGGIRTVEDMRGIILAGAEKVSVNSAAVRNPSLLAQGARRFGSQCIVLGIDAAADSRCPSGYRVFIDGGRVSTEKDMLAWGREAQALGAGEIVLNSIDADGTREGYELTATSLLSQGVDIPVVASGGAGKPEHFIEAFTRGKADAALAASMFHYGDYQVRDVKKVLDRAGLPVRLD